MDHLSLIIFYLNTFKGCKPMYNLLFKKEKKYTHLYQNGEKKVITIQKPSLNIRYYNKEFSRKLLFTIGFLFTITDINA